MFEYKKLPLGAGAYLDYIKCDKFRFSLLCVTFSLGKLTLAEKKALYVLCTMMERSCAAFPSASGFEVAVGMLYNAVISFGFSEERGGEVLLTASADFVGGDIFGEKLMDPVLDFMHGCMKDTVIGGENFDAVFAETMDYIRGNLLGDAGDPETYASLRYADFSDTELKGTVDLLSFEEKQTVPYTVNANDVERAYGLIQRAATVYAFFIGVEDADNVTDAVRKRFGNFGTFVPKKDERYNGGTIHKSDGPLGNMSRMYMGFTHGAPRAAAVLLAAYLGSCPQSRLFTVLREDKRYCYSVRAYCSSPSVITVFAAVSSRVEEKAREAVIAVIEETARTVDPEVFRAAKEFALLTAREIFDSRELCENCCFSAYITGRENPFSLADELLSLTEKDVMDAAKTLRLSLDYTCKGNNMPLNQRGYTKGKWMNDGHE